MKTQSVPTVATCPECGQGRLVAFNRDEEFDFDFGSEMVKVRAKNVPVEKCDKCGEVMSGPAAALARHEAICRAVGLMTPSEIKALREAFGWSQQFLSDLTDYGIATVSRWERGRLLQNRSANRVQLALRDCPGFRDYLAGLLGARQESRSVSRDGTTIRFPRARDETTLQRSKTFRLRLADTAA